MPNGVGFVWPRNLATNICGIITALCVVRPKLAPAALRYDCAVDDLGCQRKSQQHGGYRSLTAPTDADRWDLPLRGPFSTTLFGG
jgi:hypothetical protein